MVDSLHRTDDRASLIDALVVEVARYTRDGGKRSMRIFAMVDLLWRLSRLSEPSDGNDDRGDDDEFRR